MAGSAFKSEIAKKFKEKYKKYLNKFKKCILYRE
jgi:hypothetical protein